MSGLMAAYAARYGAGARLRHPHAGRRHAGGVARRDPEPHDLHWAARCGSWAAEEWKGCGCARGQGSRDAGGSERPPTVAEVLDRFGGRVVLMLEAEGPAEPRRTGRDDPRPRSDPLGVRELQPTRRWPGAHTDSAWSTQLWRSAEQLRTDRPARWRSYVDLLDVDHKARDADLVRAVRSGIPRVWAHTVTTPAQRDRALALGCNGIVTDAPGRLARHPVKRSKRVPDGRRGARPLRA